jgi:hypothetical protein
MAYKSNIIPRRLAPTKNNHYLRTDRPLSYQPHFALVKTQPINNYGYPEPGIQVYYFTIS